jgi:magnesium chelatase family protein
MRRAYETITDIHQRIEAAKQKPTPELSTLSAACLSLFKTGYNRLSLGVYEAEIVFNVAQTIARLEGSSIIQVEHIAEAIQYRAVQRQPTTLFYTF